ncbi:magnesium transporter [Natribacillus halophilus]|uniref:Magnesium transporter MgtE n=1 Tax=Natribacillus halophilus TaxID=549003 RepID=A0A1G8MAE0_9BACI|nr:magnesium transporter [Natribacillus halophilus]SDI64946.1 magnesium transporter [Natribacillus halophilus]
MKRLDRKNREAYAEAIMQLLRREDISAFRQTYLSLHPMDQASVFVSLDPSERAGFFDYISAEEIANMYQNLDKDMQLAILTEMDETYAGDIINAMNVDNATSLLSKLSETTRNHLLQKLNEAKKADVEELLAYPAETAGSIMTKSYLTIRPATTAQEVLEHLQEERPRVETIYYLYAVDESGRLAGVLSLRDLLTHDPSERVDHFMSTQPVTVRDRDDQEDVARLIQYYDLLAIPVLTEDEALVGIVTVDDAIDVLEEEETEDVGEFSATRGATGEKVTAFQAAKKRAPWIVLLMFLGLITAGMIEQFEETLEAIVLLAAFIPIIMDSGGNTGTQSLAVIVRGLSTGALDHIGVLKIIWREFKTGMMIGLSTALVILLLIIFVFDHAMIALVVAVSIFSTLSMATVIGTILPLIINKLKLDPAIASGPFITTMCDILGLLIYFSIATFLLDYL